MVSWVREGMYRNFKIYRVPESTRCVKMSAPWDPNPNNATFICKGAKNDTLRLGQQKITPLAVEIC